MPSPSPCPLLLLHMPPLRRKVSRMPAQCHLNKEEEEEEGEGEKEEEPCPQRPCPACRWLRQ